MKIFDKWEKRETKKKLRARIAQLEMALRIDRAEINVDRREVRTVRARIEAPVREVHPFFENHAKEVLAREIFEGLKDYINYSKHYDDALGRNALGRGRNIYVAEIKVVDMGVHNGAN